MALPCSNDRRMIEIDKSNQSIISFSCSFYYLPKFTFWQVCWFNGLSVCMPVCLFVGLFIRSRITFEPFEISSPKLVHRCILVAALSLLFIFEVKGQGHEVTTKVKIRNRRNSVNFWATAKLKKKHNVVLLKAHLYDIINLRYHFRFKGSLEVENRKCEIAISIFVSFQHSLNLIAYLETTCQT